MLRQSTIAVEVVFVEDCRRTGGTGQCYFARHYYRDSGPGKRGNMQPYYYYLRLFRTGCADPETGVAVCESSRKLTTGVAVWEDEMG